MNRRMQEAREDMNTVLENLSRGIDADYGEVLTKKNSRIRELTEQLARAEHECAVRKETSEQQQLANDYMRNQLKETSEQLNTCHPELQKDNEELRLEIGSLRRDRKTRQSRQWKR